MKSTKLTCPHCRQPNPLEARQITQPVKCSKCNKPLLDGQVIEADAPVFDLLVASPKPSVVYFWSHSCSSCKTFTPIFEKMAVNKKKQFQFIKVDAQQHKTLVNRYRLRGVPTLLVLKKGKRQAILNGALKTQAFAGWLDDAMD